MLRKGEISKIDNANKKASVTFKYLDGTVSAELPIMYHVIKDAVLTGDYEIKLKNTDETVKVSGIGEVEGTVNVEYFPDYKVNDIVIVGFYGSNLTDGVIIGKI